MLTTLPSTATPSVPPSSRTTSFIAETTYRLVEGRGLLIEHRGERLRLRPDEPVSRAEELELALAA